MFFHKRPALIHQRVDKYGKIRVLEDNIERYLLFDTNAKQSGVLKTNYKISTLKYQHIMQMVAFFRSDPKNILLVGLGGGAMANFFQTCLPKSAIKVIELRKDIYEVAQQYFNFKAQPHLKVEINSATDYFKDPPVVKQDIILLDAFINEGMPREINNPLFFECCKNHLKKQGVLVVNYWTSQYHKDNRNLDYLKHIFQQRFLKSSVTGCGNKIYFFFTAEHPRPNIKLSRDFLSAGSYYLIPYNRYLKALASENNLKFKAR